MTELVEQFPDQLKEALELAIYSSDQLNWDKVQNVLIIGLGGSGIGGQIVAGYLAEQFDKPIMVAKNYFIPEFVNEDTLVIASSYSGNTEETLMAFEKAMEKGVQAAIVTSGGELLKVAQEKGYMHIIVPGGMPPRSCLGYSMISLLRIFDLSGKVDSANIQDIRNAIMLIEGNQPQIREKAKKIASDIQDKMTIIYSSTEYEGVAVRLRQQLNENAKMLCWHHVLPEMNHNELVGWRKEMKDAVVVMIRNSDEYERVEERMRFTSEEITSLVGNIVTVSGEGNSRLERMIYLINVFDWVSIILADVQDGIDAMEINVINRLKSGLASF